MFSPPTLHPPVVVSEEELTLTSRRLQSSFSATLAAGTARVGEIDVPLTTVSHSGMFDSYVGIRLRGTPAASDPISLLVDSGNTSVILPRWEDIAALPDFAASYTVLAEEADPWGVPAKLVRGPLDVVTRGGVLPIEGCTFYACFGDGTDPTAPRTANFGTGCLTRWPVASDGSTAMRPALSLLAEYPVAGFHYAAADDLFSLSGGLRVASGSTLTLYKVAPVGVQWFDIVPDCNWMALVPKALKIGKSRTAWPGTQAKAIAMIDTGGTCAYLSDPNLVVSGKTWPSPTENPDWAATSEACHAISDPIVVTLGDAHRSFALRIDTSGLPASVRGLTLVMCKECEFMMGANGMNVGGISALCATIYIDYARHRVGFHQR